MPEITSDGYWVGNMWRLQCHMVQCSDPVHTRHQQRRANGALQITYEYYILSSQWVFDWPIPRRDGRIAVSVVEAVDRTIAGMLMRPIEPERVRIKYERGAKMAEMDVEGLNMAPFGNRMPALEIMLVNSNLRTPEVQSYTWEELMAAKRGWSYTRRALCL